MNTFVSIIIAIVMLSVLVIVHEYGHYLLAVKNGIFVKEFSVGFGPRIISKTGKKGTKFSLKAIPFGGSCEMLGRFEDEDDNTDDERSFDKKSVWARISVILAGPVFNFLLAFVLSVIYIGSAGYDPAVVTSVSEGSPAYEAGLREGDVIVGYNGTHVTFGRELYLENYLHPVSEGSEREITYIRDGEKYTITILPAEEEYYAVGVSYYADEEPAEIAEVTEDGAFAAAGLEAGDIITSINGVSIETGEDLSAYFSEYPLDGSDLTVTYMRKGVEHTCVVTPQISSAYRLGFSYNIANVEATAWETVKYSFAEVGYQIESVIKSIGYLFSGNGSLDMLSGPVGIVEIVSETYSSSVSYGFSETLLSLISLMILLSANLGVMNLLPIPALDGGKFVLLLIEAVIRKPVPKKFEGVINMIGALLLVVLMVVVLVNDVTKFF